MAAGLGKLFSGGLKGATRKASTATSRRKVQFPWKTKSAGTNASTSGTKSNPLNSGSNTPPALPKRTETPPPPPPPPLPPTNKATTTEPWTNKNGQTFKSQPSNGITPESLQAGKQNLKPIPGAADAPKSFGQKAKGLATSTFGQVVGGTLVGSAALAAGSSIFGSKGQEADPNAGSTGAPSQSSSYGYGSSSSYGIPGSMYA